MSKPSHFPAMAGTLAGLLAAALGAWYLYPQHVGPSAKPEAAAARTTTPNATTNPVARTVQPASPQQALTREQAEERLMALPELQAWAKHIETASRGTVHAAVIPFDPALRTVHGKRYHQLSFVENRPDAAVTWDSFLVGADDGAILVDDAEGGAPVTLERWRADKRPLARTAR